MRHVHLPLVAITVFLLACSPTPEACGNSVCVSGAGETCSTCPTDCGSCGGCGDGSCSGGETCSTCASDCGSCGTDAGASDAGPGACAIMAGHWTGSGVPDSSSTDPECTPQSFDQNLDDRFLVDFPAMTSSCPAGCTCTPVFATVDPPDCIVANYLDCSATSSGITSTSGWRRISATQLEGTYVQSTPGRGDCTISFSIIRVGP